MMTTTIPNHKINNFTSHMPLFSEYTSCEEISLFLQNFCHHGLLMHTKIVGYLSRKDKQCYSNDSSYDTISQAVQSKTLGNRVEFWTEGRTGKQVNNAVIQESHCNIVLLLKESKELLIFNPWKRLNREPKRIADVSSPHFKEIYW